MAKLFVGGIPLEITEMEIAILFAQYGDVETIKIVRDKISRKCKGYAFVEMKTEEAALEATNSLNGSELGGRLLTLNLVSENLPIKPVVQRPNKHIDEKAYAKIAHNISSKLKRPRKLM